MSATGIFKRRLSGREIHRMVRVGPTEGLCDVERDMYSYFVHVKDADDCHGLRGPTPGIGRNDQQCCCSNVPAASWPRLQP